MDRSPDELEAEVRDKRADVEQTIDALRAKMSMGQIVDELSGRLKGDEAQAFFANAGRQVRDNPLALGLIGAGFAWLAAGDGVRRGAGDTHDRHSEDDRGGLPAYPGAVSRNGGNGGHGVDYSGSKSAFAGAADADGDDGESMADRLDAAYGSAKDAAASASDRVSGAVADGRDLGRDAMRDVRRSAGRYGDGFMRTLEEQPLVLGALAIAVGTAIGAALPATRTEDAMMGEHRDRLRDEAGDYLGRKGAEAADNAADAYERVKDEVKRKVEDATGQSHAETVPKSPETGSS